MHSLGAPQPSSLGSINQEDPLSPVDAMSILAEVASKETEEEVRQISLPCVECPKCIAGSGKEAGHKGRHRGEVPSFLSPYPTRIYIYVCVCVSINV